MDDKQTSKSPGGLKSFLPIILGASAFVIYLITLAPWLTLRNVDQAATAGGWNWEVAENYFVPPLTFLITLPLKIIGGGSPSPILLNGLSAVCGALSVFALASAIKWFPQDRTREQRIREKSSKGLLTGPLFWVPIVSGALLFCLNLTIWENSTAFTGEMINLVVFAFIIRAIFKTRIDQSNTRMILASFLVGIGLANDGGFIGFIPFIFAGFVWVKKKDFLDFSFLVPSVGAFLLGLSLYLLVPLIHPYNGIDGVGYFERLFSYLGNQKSYILLRGIRLPAIIFGMTSVVPVLFATIRWPGQFGDMSAIGAFFSQVMFRIFHLVFLFACLYIFFDQAHSPRQSELGSTLLYLRFQFLTALAFGYYLGYFIILLSKAPESRRRKKTVLPPEFSKILAYGLSAIALISPGILVAKNSGFILGQKATPWKQYVEMVSQGINPEGEGPHFIGANNSGGRASSRTLKLLRNSLSGSELNSMILFDASGNYLFNPTYHKYLKQKYGDSYPELPEIGDGQEEYSAQDVVSIFQSLTSKGKAYYLNPSFGMFFELMYAQPSGLAYSLTPYPVKDVDFVGVSDATASKLEEMATKLEDEIIKPLIKLNKLDPPRFVKQGKKAPTDQAQLSFLVSHYCNDVGYKLLRSDRMELARRYLNMCKSVNPDNVSAEMNLFAIDIIAKTSGNLVASDWEYPEEMKEFIDEKLKKLPDVQSLLSSYGFFENPSLTFGLSQVFFNNGYPRQGYQLLMRTLELDPSNYLYYADGSMFILNQNRPDIVRRILAQLKKNINFEDVPFEDQNLALKIEAQILFREGKLDEAVKLLEDDVAKEPARESTLRFLAGIYEKAGEVDKVIEVSDRQLSRFPEDHLAILKLGLAYALKEDYQKALDTNSKALTIKEDFWQAYKNNAFIYSKLNRWEDVVTSLEKVMSIRPIYYEGHLEISHAYRKLNKIEDAVKHLKEYLVTIPSGSARALAVEKQIDELESTLEKEKD